MAQGDNIIIDVLGNTRPLEKQIEKVANTALVLNSKGFSQPLGKINGQLGEFEKSLAASNARVIAFGASAGAIFAVQKAFSETIKSVIDVEKSLTDINVILNASAKNLASFGNSLFDIAKNTGQSFSEVASAATEFSRQGLGIEDTLKRTSDALILTRLTGMGVVDSVESITAALNSFNKTSITSNELINKLAAVDAGFAVSSGDLAEAIRRVGSSAQDAGVSLDQLIALVTSAQQTTARGGAVIGNSFKTIFTRLQRTDTLDALEAIGVATKDQQGNILPLISILNSLSNVYGKLSGVQRAQVAELVGGVFQINVLKASLADLGNQYSIYSRALDASNGATNEANARNEELNQTLSATINKTLANLQKLAAQVGNIAIAPTLKNLLGGLNTALENFQPESEDIGSRIGQGLLKGIGSFLGGPGVLLAASALFKIFERLVTFSADAFKSLTGLNAKAAEQQALQGQILNLIGRNPQIIEQINSGNVNTASLHKQILTLIEQETAAMQRQVAVADALSKSLISSGVRVAQTGPMRGIPTKSAGFIPNFNANQEVAGALAGGYMPGKVKQTFIPNYGMVTYNDAEKIKKFDGFNQPAIMPPQDSRAGKNYKQSFEKAHGFNPYAWSGYVPNFAQIPEGMNLRQAIDSKRFNRSALSSRFTKAEVEKELGPSRKAAAKKVYATGQDFSILNIGNSDFDQIAGKELAKAIQSIAMKLIKPNTKKLPSADEIINQLQADTSAYPQILGRLFESSINAAINLDLNKKQGGGSGTWDYIGGNFASDKVNQSLFGGQLAAMQALPYLDAKLNATTAGASIKGKIKRTPSLKAALIQGLESGKEMINLPFGVIKSTGLSKPISFSQEDLGGEASAPNLSGLKEAIGREISAGVPASSIRVGSSSSLTSNSNPLGLGVYNTKDEPRGLNQGVNRYSSRSAARRAGAYGGYIPNFAFNDRNAYGTPYSTTLPSKPSLNLDQKLSQIIDQVAKNFSSLKDSTAVATEKIKTLAASTSKVKVLFDDNALPQSIQKYKTGLIQASIGLSLASGLLQEATKNSPKLSEAIEGFSSTLSLAGTAAQVIPGKFGIFGAALLATTGTFGTIANLLKEKSAKLAEKAEQSSQTLTDFSNSSQKYADILQKLQDAQKDPKTSSQTIGKLNEDLIKAAGQIPDAYRKQLVSITNYTDLLDQMSKVQSELANEESYNKGAAGFEEILNKRTGNNMAQFAEALSLKPLFNPRESIGYGLTGSEMERTTSNISSKGFENNQARENLKRMLASGELDIFKTAGSATFNPKKLEELGLKKDAIESITRLAQQGGNNSITPGQAVKAGFNTIGAIRDASKGDFNPFSGKGTGSISAQTLVQNVLTKLLEEAVGGEEAKKLVEQRAKETDIINKENAAKQRSIDIEKSRQDALDNFYQRLIQIGDIQQEYKDKLAFNTQDVQLQRASGLLEYNRSSMGPQSAREYQNLIETAKQQLDFAKKYKDQETKARSDVLQEGYKTFLDLKKENVPGQTPKVDVEKLNQFQTVLGQLATSGKSADQIGQEITNSFNQFFGGTAYGSKAIDLQTQANNILGDNQRALLDLNAQQIKQTELTKINNQIQAASIQKQRDVRSFGGLESYINPQSNSTIDSLVTNIQGLGTPVGGRASAGTLLDTVKMFGGSLEGANLGGLKERAIAGRAQDIQFQTSAISKLLSRKGEFGLAGEYDKIGARSGEIARTQVEEAIQSQRAVLDINKNVATITSSLKTFTGAFTQPNQTNGLPNQPGINLQNASKAVGDLTSGMRQVELKNTDLSLKGNVAVDINQPNGPIEFTIDSGSVDNIKQDITTQVQDSLATLRTDLENKIKDLTNSFNERIVSVGGQRLPPTKK
jgi:TP901 family phage tail tape measure protein